jgi:hypothetical protein
VRHRSLYIEAGSLFVIPEVVIGNPLSLKDKKTGFPPNLKQ